MATIWLLKLGKRKYKFGGDYFTEEPTIEYIEKKYPGIRNDLKPGDIIENVDQSGWRSTGWYFYALDKIIQLDTSYDDYGSPYIWFYDLYDLNLDHYDSRNMRLNNKYARHATSEGAFSINWTFDETYDRLQYYYVRESKSILAQYLNESKSELSDRRNLYKEIVQYVPDYIPQPYPRHRESDDYDSESDNDNTDNNNSDDDDNDRR
jgi:hypothetical protein